MKKPRVASTCDCGSHSFVRATKHGVIIADVEDADFLSSRCWSLSSKNYAQCLDGKLHRMLLEHDGPEFVDHANGDKLDNRRSNLRLCAAGESVWNRGKLKTKAVTSSKYKGVTWCGKQGWVARIGAYGKRHWLGAFKTEGEAAAAYDSAAVQLHGEFARTNFKGEVTCRLAQ